MKTHTKLFLAFFVGLLLEWAAVAVSQSPVFNIFEPPASGSIMVSNASYNPRAATYSDVAGLFTGCSGSSPVPDVVSGACISQGGTIASPSGTVGLSAVTGATGNYMDAGSAPALSQAITPTWTNLHTFAAGLLLSNSETIEGKSTGGTPYSIFYPLDNSNNSDIENDAGGNIGLYAASSAGGTLNAGLKVFGVNSTYSQTEIEDAGGNLQNAGYLGAPQDVETSNYSLALIDRGKSVINTGGSGTISYTVPASVFSAGDLVIVVAWYGTSITIVQASGLTLYWANGGTSTTGNRTLTPVGVAYIYFASPTVAFISGGGLS